MGLGAENVTRTRDLRITNALLYQLSYFSVKPIIYQFRRFVNIPIKKEALKLPNL